MKFSIIIPAHNSAGYIQNALDSVVEQTFEDYELIVVCDSCTDNTEEIAKEYGARTVAVDYHCDGLTRNKGIEMAEERHREERVQVYLASKTFLPQQLTTYTKPQFKVAKRVFGYHARLLTMTTLKRGCYYYTKNTYGMDGIDEKEKELRRQFFIKERLRLARLID